MAVYDISYMKVYKNNIFTVYLNTLLQSKDNNINYLWIQSICSAHFFYLVLCTYIEVIEADAAVLEVMLQGTGTNYELETLRFEAGDKITLEHNFQANYIYMF